MSIIYWTFFFLLGLIIGSFLNSIVYRLEKKESIVAKRSYCPFCKKVLSWFELIPLMSFIFQKGRCRNCNKKISYQYPLVELATGILFLLIFNFSAQGGSAAGWQFLISTVFLIFVVSCLIVIFIYDLRHYIIPNQVVYSGIVVGLLYQVYLLFLGRDLSVCYNILSTIFVGALFLGLILISKGKTMGLGDFKLVIFMGLILSWPKILVALFLAFVIGALISVILIIFKKKGLKSQIPFGPFLTGATVVTLFWGDILINLYLGFL